MIAGIPWDALAAQTVILTFVSTLLVFLLLPRARAWLWTVLESDRPKLRALVKESLGQELKALAELKELAEGHDDTLEFVKASLQMQGEEMRQLPRIANSLEQQARSFKEMTVTLTKIHEEVTDHGKRFERWDGFMEGQDGKWVGDDRRKTKRRTEDQEP